VPTNDVFAFIKNYLAQEEVDSFVIGESKNLDNTKSQVAEAIEEFAEKLNRLPIDSHALGR
jgi:RNase H-fold protein (predicted Holliday junction resolvase)